MNENTGATSGAAAAGDVAVTQADREAAYRLRIYTNSLREDDYRAKSLREVIHSGEWDDKEIVQAFARHRLAADQADRTEIERLRGLLVDPGSPPWEDARAVLVAELVKAGLHQKAKYVADAQGEDIPSHIALNLIAQAACTTTTEGGRDLRAALSTATGLQSGPNGAGRMKVVIDGLEPGKEGALFHLLSSALASPRLTTPAVASAEVREAAQFLSDRLDQLEWHDDALEDGLRDYMGHVDPAHWRLKQALAALPPTETPDDAGRAGVDHG